MKRKNQDNLNDTSSKKPKVIPISDNPNADQNVKILLCARFLSSHKECSQYTVLGDTIKPYLDAFASNIRNKDLLKRVSIEIISEQDTTYRFTARDARYIVELLGANPSIEVFQLKIENKSIINKRGIDVLNTFFSSADNIIKCEYPGVSKHILHRISQSLISINTNAQIEFKFFSCKDNQNKMKHSITFEYQTNFMLSIYKMLKKRSGSKVEKINLIEMYISVFRGHEIKLAKQNVLTLVSMLNLCKNLKQFNIFLGHTASTYFKLHIPHGIILRDYCYSKGIKIYIPNHVYKSFIDSKNANITAEIQFYCINAPSSSFNVIQIQNDGFMKRVTSDLNYLIYNNNLNYYNISSFNMKISTTHLKDLYITYEDTIAISKIINECKKLYEFCIVFQNTNILLPYSHILDQALQSHNNDIVANYPDMNINIAYGIKNIIKNTTEDIKIYFKATYKDLKIPFEFRKSDFKTGDKFMHYLYRKFKESTNNYFMNIKSIRLEIIDNCATIPIVNYSIAGLIQIIERCTKIIDLTLIYEGITLSALNTKEVYDQLDSVIINHPSITQAVYPNIQLPVRQALIDKQNRLDANNRSYKDELFLF